MSVTQLIENKVCVVTVENESEMGQRNTVREYIENGIREQQIEAVLLDLENTPFLSSAGVGKIITIYKILEQHDIPLALCHLTQKNQKIFTMTHLDQILNIHLTKDEALSALEQAKV